MSRATDQRHRGLATVAAWCAAGAGLLHGAFSLIWAAGETWLLDTVGEAAPAMLTEAGVPWQVTLILIGAARIVAAIVPVFVVRQQLPWLQGWRALCWPGGALLALYGAMNTGAAALVLAGVIVPAGGFNEVAMRGHAFLWGPLFLIWGAALLIALWQSGRALPRRRSGQ